MPLSVAYKAVDFISNLRKNHERVIIGFSGGEPLTVFGKLRKIVKYARTQGNIHNFILCTNGVNVGEKQIEFFLSNNISPTISMDGIPEAQDLNRPLLSNKTTYKKVDKILDLFSRYSEYFNRRFPDYLRIRCTFTPETVRFLNSSIRYFANKPIAKIAMITLMPGMLPKKRWEALSRDKSLSTVLNEQIKKIYRFYIRRQKENNPFQLCVNECLTADFNNSAFFRKKPEVPFCGIGITQFGISLSGEIYPCYLFAARPEENRNFCLGNVSNGFKSRKEINKIRNKFKANKFLSCPYWNFMENGYADRPVLIFREFYQSLQKAIATQEK